MPCLIVGTQTDLREDKSVKDKLDKQRMRPVRTVEGEQMAKDLGAVKYVECSALTQYKLKDVFDEVSSLFFGAPVFLSGLEPFFRGSSISSRGGLSSTPTKLPTSIPNPLN